MSVDLRLITTTDTSEQHQRFINSIRRGAIPGTNQGVVDHHWIWQKGADDLWDFEWENKAQQKRDGAIRYAWAYYRAPLQVKTFLVRDHRLCKNPCCVNPWCFYLIPTDEGDRYDFLN
jgi:hypothetical protein